MGFTSVQVSTKQNVQLFSVQKQQSNDQEQSAILPESANKIRFMPTTEKQLQTFGKKFNAAILFNSLHI